MPKKLSDIQKKEIIQRFIKGETLDSLANKFGYTKLTISRNIKKNIGLDLFNNLNKNINDSIKENITDEIFKVSNSDRENRLADKHSQKDSLKESFSENQFSNDAPFMELVPLDLDIDNSIRKDFASISIEEIDFSGTIYMIVDKKIELDVKVLRDYPEWQFLPEEDLDTKTIKIYSDLRDAKRDCKKDQKVIKVPNPNVFKIASKIMLSRGISRIISDKKLISL